VETKIDEEAAEAVEESPPADTSDEAKVEPSDETTLDVVEEKTEEAEPSEPVPSSDDVKEEEPVTASESVEAPTEHGKPFSIMPI
jgi:hypothetical protein